MSLKARMELLEEGKVYRGVVRHVVTFGLFVELIEGQEHGLLYFDRTLYPEIARLLQVGQSVKVIATVVDAQRESVRVQLLPDPTRYDGFWSRAKGSGWEGRLSASPAVSRGCARGSSFMAASDRVRAIFMTSP